jgi:DNA invertase Pin-like site-specific DNA recombinase
MIRQQLTFRHSSRTLNEEVTGQQSNHSVKARLERLHLWNTRSDQGVLRSQNTAESDSAAIPTRRKQRRLPLEQVHELIAGYEAGVPINTLAAPFEIHRSTVLDHVTRTGTHRRYPALDRRQLGQAVQLYRAGRSLRHIGIRFGVHASTVGRYLTQAGLKLRDCQGRER